MSTAQKDSVQAAPCDHIILDVRADDLALCSLVEGEARLTNQLYLLPPHLRDKKTVVNWDLHIRHRQRVTLARKEGDTQTSHGIPRTAQPFEKLCNVESADGWNVLEEESIIFDASIKFVPQPIPGCE